MIRLELDDRRIVVAGMSEAALVHAALLLAADVIAAVPRAPSDAAGAASVRGQTGVLHAVARRMIEAREGTLPGLT